MSPHYPGIETWFETKVIPGACAGTRKILTIKRNGEIVGLGIAKDEDEKKICTVRVSNKYYGSGLGIRIFDQLLDWLDVSNPILTVGEEKLPQFSRIFDHYGFKLTSYRKDLYQIGRTELVFNEKKKLFI